MYVAKQFEVPEKSCWQMLAGAQLYEVIWKSGSELVAVPIVLRLVDKKLMGHIARPSFQPEPTSDAVLALAHFGDTIVTTDMLVDTAKPNPTWDFVVIHVTGRMHVETDPVKIASEMMALSSEIEADWNRGDMTKADAERVAKATVQLVIEIDAVVGKAKLSQNKTPEEIRRIADAIDSKDPYLAKSMRDIALPHAVRRWDTIKRERERFLAKKSKEGK